MAGCDQIKMRWASVFLLLTLALAGTAQAHDIPADITVRAFVKPQGQTLRVLFRLPLRAVTDVEYARREQDYVDLSRVDPALRDTARGALVDNFTVTEDDTPLAAPAIVAARMSLESDRSFESYDAALANVGGPPLDPATTLFWEQGLLDVLVEYPIRSETSRFAVHAAFDRFALKTITSLQFLPPRNMARAYQLEGDAGLVRLEPRWHQAAMRFVNEGFKHILGGMDHLLFLLCLVIPFRRAQTIVPIVTAFTVAHSFTLIASAFGYAPSALWFPPLIETLIAVSIVYMALENIIAPQVQRRWVIAFGIGLIHGFGFSFGLQHTLQFAGEHLVTSLIAFNIGIELGQLLVLALMIPVLGILFRHVVAERMGTIILSALITHTAWHWMTERIDVLAQFPVPEVTAEGMADLFGWLFALVALVAMGWIGSLVAQRLDVNGKRKPEVLDG